MDVRDLGNDVAAGTAGAATMSSPLSSPVSPPSVAEIESFARRLAADAVAQGDAGRIDRMAALELLRDHHPHRTHLQPDRRPPLSHLPTEVGPRP